MHNIDKDYVSILTPAAESAIGLAIRAVVFRNRQTLIVEDLSSLKG
jgi:NADH:ubiquinone oxidoreductase subunit K